VLLAKQLALSGGTGHARESLKRDSRPFSHVGGNKCSKEQKEGLTMSEKDEKEQAIKEAAAQLLKEHDEAIDRFAEKMKKEKEEKEKKNKR
jgi:hypothetical protein